MSEGFGHSARSLRADWASTDQEMDDDNNGNRSSTVTAAAALGDHDAAGDHNASAAQPDDARPGQSARHWRRDWLSSTEQETDANNNRNRSRSPPAALSAAFAVAGTRREETDVASPSLERAPSPNPDESREGGSAAQPDVRVRPPAAVPTVKYTLVSDRRRVAVLRIS